MISPVEKGVLRDRFRAYRRTLSAEAHQRLSQRVTERARGVDALRQAETVHIYWPLLDRGEIDTRPLVDWLLSRDCRVVLPRVVSTAAGHEPLMEHVAFDDASELRSNGWGLLEPAGDDLVAPEELDAVVVPAFGAGRNGHRIGHGLGFYDAFLRGLDAARLCLTYHATLVAAVPAEPHDVPMTHVITEREVVQV